jgi:hypothetical protein
MFNSSFGKKPPEKDAPLTWEPKRRQPLSQNNSQEPLPAYSKVFRWNLPDGQTAAPGSVEIVGSFTGWEKVPLTRDHKHSAWQVTLDQIPAHQTHHYVLLVDGKPAQDKNCDGLAIAHGAQEERYALSTHRGPRVCMLFAQTK